MHPWHRCHPWPSIGYVATCLLLAAACSASDTHPPELGACDSNCSVAPVGAGGTSGGAGDAAVAANCSTTTNDSQCLQCLGSNCCTMLNACLGNPDCQNLLSCENACTDSACLSMCKADFPNGVLILDNLTPCETSRCPVCSQSGTGDPCVPGETTCNVGLSCVGLWCSKTCLHASDCVGLGASGGDSRGQTNSCVHSSSSGDICFPGCTTDADCEPFPGTFCLSFTSVDALPATICASSRDAGTD